MLYNLSTVLKDENGDNAKDTQNGKEVDATVGKGLIKALVSDPLSRPFDADTKVKRFELFYKLLTANIQEPIELSVDEVALAKEAVNIYPTLLYGQLVRFLNQKE